MDRSPSFSGIAPVRSLSLRLSSSRLDRAPSFAGSVPARPRLIRETLLTRETDTLNPSQSPIAVVVSQLSVVPVPTNCASDASNASQSSTRPPLDEPPTAVEPAQPRASLSMIVSVALPEVRPPTAPVRTTVSLPSARLSSVGSKLSVAVPRVSPAAMVTVNALIAG